MKMRKLGSSNIDASVVAFGSWAVGGWMWGGTNETDSIHAVHAALDSGINLIDTAPIYGFGLSESLIGKALKGRRDKAVIATKCGMVANTRKGEFKFNSTASGADENGHIGIYIHLAPESIEREVEMSLRRLGTDYIDLYQTHWQEEATPREETMAMLLRLKEQGKIRAVGVSNADISQMREYFSLASIDTDQEKYSMLDRELENEQLPFCRENNISVLAYSPLAQGLLTGKMTPDREFAKGDVRRGSPRFSVENRKRVNTMLNSFQSLAEEKQATLAQLAIAWTFHQPGLTHVLCGARNPDQARENAGAGDIRLEPDDVRQMTNAINDLKRS